MSKVIRVRERTATQEELADDRRRCREARESRRPLRTTVEIPVVETTAQLLCQPKSYRDENWHTECAKTAELPAIATAAPDLAGAA